MVTLTKTAAEEVQRIISDQEIESEENFLRVGVKGGGCSGFSYSLDIVEAKSDDDESWDQHGISVICDDKSHLYLDGTEIDFKDGMMGRGFVFSNPNSTSVCGCGSSFNT